MASTSQVAAVRSKPQPLVVLAVMSGAIPVALGMLALLAWQLGRPSLISFDVRFIPMARSTGTAFLLLGACLLALTIAPRPPVVAGARLLTLGVLLFTALKLLEFFSVLQLGIEEAVFPADEAAGYVVGMAPLTSAMFLVAALALLAQVWSNQQVKIDGLLSVLVAVPSFLIVLAYVSQEPLLYNLPGVIPVALPTALAFLALSLGLTARAGTDRFPLRQMAGASTRARLLRAFLPVSVVVMLVDTLLSRVFPGDVNPAVLAALGGLASATVICVVAYWTAARVGGALDRARAGREQALLELNRANAELERRVEERTSELTEANHALERERVLQAAVMSSMTDGLLVIDPDGRIRYCNTRAGDLMGADAQGLIGHGAELVPAQLAAVIWGGGSARLEQRPSFEVSLPGPPRRDLLVLTFPVITGGGQNDVGVLLHDATAERDLARAKDELVAVVSHELRTPLASLVGFAELLLSRDYSEAQRRQFLTVMHQEGQRLTDIINDFLDLQRMESGRLTVHACPTDLRPILERVTASAGEDLERPIVLDLPESLPPVEGDADRLIQVFANLVSNARKYSPDGGEVRISAAADEHELEVSVRDQGLGLPRDAIPQLFQKFYRVDNSDRRSITGTGLGLAICQQIVVAHGGRIWAESAGLGTGSCFRLTLPRSQPVLATGDVLVVEDDRAFALLLESELRACGLTAFRAPTADAALELVRRQQPAALVLDLLLPGRSGESLLREMKSMGHEKLPTFILSVKDLSPDERQALEEAGARGIFRKGPGAAAATARAAAQALAAQDLAANAGSGEVSTE